MKQGIRNRPQFTDFANLQLFSPTRIQQQRDSTLKVDSPYLPQMEASILSPYSRWESSLVRKPNPTLTSDEYESFVRIGTPQERFKLQLPPPLEEVITPDPSSTYNKKKLVSRADSKPENESSNSSNDENEDDEGFSRPGTAMTGIFLRLTVIYHAHAQRKAMSSRSQTNNIRLEKRKILMTKAVTTRTVLASMTAETMKGTGPKESMKNLAPTIMRLKVCSLRISMLVLIT